MGGKYGNTQGQRVSAAKRRSVTAARPVYGKRASSRIHTGGIAPKPSALQTAKRFPYKRRAPGESLYKMGPKARGESRFHKTYVRPMMEER
jgi:hypothetical protein